MSLMGYDLKRQSVNPSDGVEDSQVTRRVSGNCSIHWLMRSSFSVVFSSDLSEGTMWSSGN